MKLLEQILKESLANTRIHENPSVDKLKQLAKTSEYKMARFIVKDNEIVLGADGSNFVHHDMLPPEALKEPHQHEDSYLKNYHHQRGLVIHNGGPNFSVELRDYIHNNTVGHSSGWRLVNHPILDEFNKKGITPKLPRTVKSAA